VRADGRWRSVFELLGHDVCFTGLAAAFPWLREVPPRVLGQLQTEARYAGYLPRQQAEILAFEREEWIDLSGVAFAGIGGLSAELVNKWPSVGPAPLGAASGMQGMTPAAIVAIATHIRKQKTRSVSRETS